MPPTDDDAIKESHLLLFWGSHGKPRSTNFPTRFNASQAPFILANSIIPTGTYVSLHFSSFSYRFELQCPISMSAQIKRDIPPQRRDLYDQTEGMSRLFICLSFLIVFSLSLTTLEEAIPRFSVNLRHQKRSISVQIAPENAYAEYAIAPRHFCSRMQGRDARRGKVGRTKRRINLFQPMITTSGAQRRGPDP